VSFLKSLDTGGNEALPPIRKKLICRSAMRGCRRSEHAPIEIEEEIIARQKKEIAMINRWLADNTS